MPYWLVESFYHEQQASLQYRAKLCYTLKEALDLSTNAVLVRERETDEPVLVGYKNVDNNYCLEENFDMVDLYQFKVEFEELDEDMDGGTVAIFCKARETLNSNDFLRAVYDLLKGNEQYNPQEKLDEMFVDHVKDFQFAQDAGDDSARIVLRTNDNTEYQITMQKVYQGGAE